MINLPGYCQRAGGVLTAFWTAAAAAAAAALVTPIVTASDERGIMVELVPAKNMFWLRLGVVQPEWRWVGRFVGV